MEILKSEIKIHFIRKQHVMLDFDLASLYQIETKVLNQSVRRNLERFPEDFMFRLNKEEWNNLMRSQIVTASVKKRNTKVLPFAFTEHGVTMLSSVLRSQRAVKMNIAIVRAFVAMRNVLIDFKTINEQLKFLKEKIGEHDGQLNEIYNSIEMLLIQKKNLQDWNDRDRIGFKTEA
ncbi:MAG: ORF6N domain-containing protein [Ferruginibacter sp.]|nr:ORF6N domain-containing protein [Ferruginibacter sp.]